MKLTTQAAKCRNLKGDFKEMMNTLKKKLRGGEGFTLIEMLIVVAIIAILIAISIPMISNALEKARHSTDAANERAAKAAGLLRYMETGVSVNDMSYDAAKGILVESSVSTGNYGKHKNHTYLTVSAGDSGATVAWKDGNSLCGDYQSVGH